jgi:hypothetical protein
MEGDKTKQEQDRLIINTEKGIIPTATVTNLKQIHQQTLAEQGVEVPTPVKINNISANQTQEYFAIATASGFEILQNDSSNKRLKKKVQELENEVCIVEMMYKTNVIVLVYANQRNKVVIWDDHEKKNRTEITFNAN